MSIEVAAPPRASAIVPANEWVLITRQADALALSDIIPTAYRRRPANVLVAAMTGRRYGWDVLTAMRNGHVIEGTWTMKPEAMLGLVRAAGHSVKTTFVETGATVTGRRVDNGDEMSVTFTYDDAVTAELVTLRDGKPYARSRSGAALPWQQYPKVMCGWRATALLCRLLFSDITGGVYSSEELGVPIDVDGEVIDVGDVTPLPLAALPLSAEALTKFHEACRAEGVDPDDVLAVAFPAGVPDPLTDEHLPRMREIFKELAGTGTPPDIRHDDNEPAVEANQLDLTAVEPEPVADAESRPAGRGHVGRIKAQYQRLGISRDAQLAETAEIIGRPVQSHNQLTIDEAEQLIEALAARPV